MSGLGLAGGLAGCGSGTETPTSGDGSSGDGSSGDGSSGDGSSGDGSSGDDTATSDSSGSGEILDPAFTTGQTALPQDVQWNPFNESGEFATAGQRFEYVPTAVMLPSTQETFPMLLSNWSIDGTTATVEMNDWFTWTNGDAVDAHDLETQLYLAQQMGYPYMSRVEELQQTGDYSLEMKVDSELNPDLFYGSFHRFAQIRPRLLHTKHELLADYRERFEDVSTDSEATNVQSDLASYRIDEPQGYGPYHLNPDRTSDEKMVYERNDDYPLTKIREQVSEAIDYDFSNVPDELQIPEWETVVANDRRVELVLADELDGSGLTSITPELQNQAPDHMELFGVPSFSGTNLVPDLGDEIFGRRRVRQAIAHLVPYEQGTDLMYGELGRPDTLQTSLSVEQEESWISENLRSAMPRYERDQEKAASLLEEEGFSRQNGTWVDENGESIEVGGIPIPASLSQKVKAFEAISQILNDFGLKASIQTSDWSGWSDAMESRDFKLAHSYMGGGPHPYRAFQPSFGGTWWTSQRQWYEDQEVTVPALGESDGTTSINPTQVFDELAQNLSQEEQKQRIEQLAWTFSHDLPFIGICFTDAASMQTTDHWQLQPFDDVMWQQQGARFIQNYLGLVQPKYE